MGRLERLKSFARSARNGTLFSEAKVDPGGGALVLAPHAADAGDDSHPLDTDYVVTVDIKQEGGRAVVGYIDPKNAGITAAGEKRIYSRDSTGAIVASFWLKNDGSVLCANATGQFELEASGNVVINGVVIDILGNITTPAAISALSVLAAGKELVGHDHVAGIPPGNTGPNN